jgi:hypothetical protein
MPKSTGKEKTVDKEVAMACDERTVADARSTAWGPGFNEIKERGDEGCTS